jgi:hypothetical protein
MLSAPGTGVGLSNFNLTDNGGAAVVWWQYGQATAFSNIFNVTDSTAGRMFSQ